MKDWSDSVYPGVYDGLDNVMFEYKNGDMQMQVNLDMNNKIISGLINPLYDSEATYSKRNTLELLPVVFFTISVFLSQEIFISICIQLFW